MNIIFKNSEIFKMDYGKNFTSIVSEEEIQSKFSLHLSDSYVDETQESFKLLSDQNLKKVVLISDSSSDESLLLLNNASKVFNNNNHTSSKLKTIQVDELSDKKVFIKPFQKNSVENIEKSFNVIINTNIISKNILESSESDIACSESNDINNKTTVKNVTLSKRKKIYILNWLEKNFDEVNDHRVGSENSYSLNSIISDSRENISSSENSSLERLEKNFETPNNRNKLQLNKQTRKKSDGQSRISKFLKSSKDKQLKTATNNASNCQSSQKVSKNYHNLNLSVNNKIYSSVNSKRMSSQQSNFKKIQKHKSFVTKKKKLCNNVFNTRLTVNAKLNPEKSSKNKFYDSIQDLENIPLYDVKKNFILSEPVPLKFQEDSKIKRSSVSNEECLNESLKFNNCNSKQKHKSEKLTIEHTKKPHINIAKKLQKNLEFFPKTLENLDNVDYIKKSDLIIKNKKGLTMSENHFYINSKTNECATCVSKSYNSNDKYDFDTKKLKNEKLESVSKIFKITNNTDYLDMPIESNVDNNEHINKLSQLSPTAVNTTIDDCADILETLYGKAWKIKTKSLISSNETKNHMKKLSDNEEIANNNKLSRDCQINHIVSDEKQIKSTAFSNLVPSHICLLENNTSSTLKIDKKKKKKSIVIDKTESNINNYNSVNNTIKKKLDFDSSSGSITSEFDPNDIVLPKLKSKKKSTDRGVAKIKYMHHERLFVKKSFLASLSKDVPFQQADFKAMTFRLKYKTMRDELCMELFKLYNKKVFDNKLPKDLSIEWSTRLRGTAGQCYNKQSVKAFGNIVRSSRIVLSTKILDTPDRLRDTLIHEMCHAATWLVNNVSDGHGWYWKSWVHKVALVFPELPSISRCHNYEIQTKYTYKCISCGYSLNRHSKSLDINKKRCNYCHGKFELLINKITNIGKVQKKSTTHVKEPLGFALYVKENYQHVKKKAPNIKHGDVMKMLSKQFSDIKLNNLQT